MSKKQQLEQAIAIQESLRGTIDDAIIDATINALHAQLDALETPVAPESRRTQATILFMDLAGHTDMIQGRDPEEIMEIIDNALQRLAEPITRYGGRIVRFQGDGFKAVFGLPTSRENDPDNAVLSGLDILTTAATIAAELETEREMPGFQVRVGIDTGPVLIGGGTEGEDAVTGLPVNLAARLESAAAPGTVLISHHTYQHIRGVFDFQSLDAIQAKGFPEPVPVYRVLRRKERSFRTRRRGVEGVETRMIGRAAELVTLQDLFAEMIARRACVSAVVVGDAGLGKSRLLYEFENWADLQPATVQLYRGRARLETRKLPYGLLRDVFVFRCGIHDDDAMPAVRAKLVDGFRVVFGSGESAEMKAHIVGHLLGYDFHDSPHIQPLSGDARQLRSQAMFYMTEYFRAAAERSPLLLLLEDLHWADDSSLDAVASLAAAMMDKAVMFLAAARPTLYERRPDWMANHPSHRRIDLSSLTPTDSGLLVMEILKRAGSVPQRLSEIIVERAEGNPFYVEELVKMLIDDGVIVTGEHLWHVEDDKLADLNIPPTLVGVLQTRLEALPVKERDALQMASVLGRLFWDAAVAYLQDPRTGQIDRELWSVLRRRELVYWREESAFEGADEYVFKHAILRDVTYESVLRRLRRDYHRRAAEWLIMAGGDRVDEYADQIADHFAAAGAVREEAEWQGRAGKIAANRYALPEAIRALSRALELTPANEPAARFDLLSARWQAYSLLGDRARELADLAELDQLASTLADRDLQAQVAVDRTRYYMSTGAYEKAVEMSNHARALAEAVGNVMLQARAISYCGNILMFLGDYPGARANLEHALSLARSVDAKRVQLDTTRILGIVAEELGDFAAQKMFYEESLALAREVGDRVGERRALNSLGVVALGGGAHDLARAYYRESLAIARAIGDRVGEGTVLGNMGVQASNLGDYPLSRTLFEEALQIAREVNDQTGININMLNLAGILSHMGNTDDALSRYDEAMQGAQETGDQPLMGYILNGKGRTLLAGNRLPEAKVVLRQALDLRVELGQLHLAAETRAYLSEAMAADGDIPAALIEAEITLEFLEKGQLEDFEDEMRVLLSLYRVLNSAADSRADTVLSRAYGRLRQATDMLDDASRQGYLNNVPWNRDIVSLWEHRNGS